MLAGIAALNAVPSPRGRIALVIICHFTYLILVTTLAAYVLVVAGELPASLAPGTVSRWQRRLPMAIETVREQASRPC